MTTPVGEPGGAHHRIADDESTAHDAPGPAAPEQAAPEADPSTQHDAGVSSGTDRSRDGLLTPDFSAPVPHGVLPTVPGVRLDSQIGRGGYATVYRARQLSVDRDVAVKVDDRRLLDSRDRRRFTREIVAAGAVSAHPHIVTVYDGGTTADDHPYLVMELYSGGSYSDRMRKSGPVAPTEVLDVGIGISDALAAAHADGILHRDVKPGNILISRYGSAALADFGLAALPRAAEGFSVTMESLTPSYAPPEAFSGADPTPGMDIYSLGATLYGLLIGRAPRSDRSGAAPPLARLLFMLNEPLPAPELPGTAAIMPVIWRATAADPAHRYPTAAAMHEDLVAVKADLSHSLATHREGATHLTGSWLPADQHTGAHTSAPSVAGIRPAGPPTTGAHTVGPPSAGQHTVGPPGAGHPPARPPVDATASGPFGLFGGHDPTQTQTHSGAPAPIPATRRGRRRLWMAAAAVVAALVATGLILFGGRSTTSGLAQAAGSSTATRPTGLATDLGRLTNKTGTVTPAVRTTAPPTTRPTTTEPSTKSPTTSEKTQSSETSAATTTSAVTTTSRTSTSSTVPLVTIAPPVGSCWGALSELGGQVTSEQLDCSKPHLWEAYATGLLAPSTPTPYQSDVLKDPNVLKTCTTTALAKYLGPTTQTRFKIDILPPRLLDFSSGAKGFWCVAAVDGAGSVTGSMRDSS